MLIARCFSRDVGVLTKKYTFYDKMAVGCFNGKKRQSVRYVKLTLLVLVVPIKSTQKQNLSLPETRFLANASRRKVGAI